MTAQERAAFIRNVMQERQQQGYSFLEAHSYAVQQLAMMEQEQERRADRSRGRAGINRANQGEGEQCNESE